MVGRSSPQPTKFSFFNMLPKSDFWRNTQSSLSVTFMAFFSSGKTFFLSANQAIFIEYSHKNIVQTFTSIRAGIQYGK